MKFSDNYDTWYISGIYAWITAIVVFAFLTLFGLSSVFAVAASGGLLVWLVVPYVFKNILEN